MSKERNCNCDWCGKFSKCLQWQDTHYWICLTCAINAVTMAKLSGGLSD